MSSNFVGKGTLLTSYAVILLQVGYVLPENILFEQIRAGVSFRLSSDSKAEVSDHQLLSLKRSGSEVRLQ